MAHILHLTMINAQFNALTSHYHSIICVQLAFLLHSNILNTSLSMSDCWPIIDCQWVFFFLSETCCWTYGVAFKQASGEDIWGIIQPGQHVLYQ